MVISILIDTDELCQEIQKGASGKIWNVLEKLENFPNEYLLPENGQEELINAIYQNRRSEECTLLSRKLEKKNKDGRVQILIDEEQYQQRLKDILAMTATEAGDLQDILCRNGKFACDKHWIRYNDNIEGIRNIDSVEKLKYALIVFGNAIDNEKEFAEHIVKVYEGLYFDEAIEASLHKLEAGIRVRKGEILYHLYCIEREIPKIIEENGMLDNQSLGALLSVPCSPERRRDVVKNELTKRADGGAEIKCELHTKMQKIGDRKPDRIYFCASVPEGIQLNKMPMQGRIYIYKITEHAGGK